MGLDIYLSSAADAEADRLHYSAYDDDNTMSDEERKIWLAEHPSSPLQDTPSHQYPDHLFKRDYLRSSYNDSGFNHAVPEMLGSSSSGMYPNERGSLYWIFEPTGRNWHNGGDEAPFTSDDVPKLLECKQRALDVAQELRNSDNLRVMAISPNIFSGPSAITEDEALQMYREHVIQRGGEPKDGDWYSQGPSLNVFGGGLKVLAAIPGMGTFKEPSVHLIYRASNEAFDSYIQSAEITAEFCDEAISLIERDGSCKISWSG